MCSPLFVLHPQCVSSLPISPPPSSWFLRLCFAAVSEMREKAEQEAKVLCRDSASQSDKIAVIFFFCRINTQVVFPSICTYTRGIFAFIDAVLPFHFEFHRVWNIKWKNGTLCSPLAFLFLFYLPSRRWLDVRFRCKTRHPVMFPLWQRKHLQAAQ